MPSRKCYIGALVGEEQTHTRDMMNAFESLSIGIGKLKYVKSTVPGKAKLRLMEGNDTARVIEVCP